MKRIIFYLLLPVTLFFITSCSDDEEQVVSNTIVDVAVEAGDFSILVSALQRTGLDATLAGAGAFTVFAPTDAAFNRLGVDLSTLTDRELSDILLYHVVGADITSGEIASGQTYLSTASASGPNNALLSILVENNGGAVTINGSADVTTADVDASNGTIHIIDEVLMPLDVVGHAAANSNFTSLVSTLSSAPGGLVGALGADGPFTVFAPVNTAFDDIADVVATLMPDQIATVLTYHVVAGANVTSGDLENGATVSTLSGQDLTVDLTDGPKLVDATGASSNIVLTDVQATNGIIHVLDRVVLPNLQ